MNITVISKLGGKSNDLLLQPQLMNENMCYYSGQNTSTLAIILMNRPNNNIYKYPGSTILIEDILGISDKIAVNKQYDCVLEIGSFSIVANNTNNCLSIRGYYRKHIPEKYHHICGLWKEQPCIEVGEDIFLISNYYKSMLNNFIDGELIELIPQNKLHLKSINLVN